MIVYKVVSKRPLDTGFVLTSVIATDRYLREYKVGEPTTSDPPMFVFTDVFAAFEFAQEFGEAGIVVYAAETDAVFDAPSAIPYSALNPRMQTAEWDMFWQHREQWEQMAVVKNWMLPRSTSMAYKITLTKELLYGRGQTHIQP